VSAAAEPGGQAPADTESRAHAGDHMALRLWLRLLACTNLVEAPLRSRLREQFQGSLPRFDLMAQLDRQPGGMKMRELSRRLMVTGGNVTGLTDRLVAEGLVERHDDPSDRRAWTVQLTPEGRRQFRAMARAHEAWVMELFSGLDAAQQAQLFELLGRLKQSLPPR
jgi:DNA-binding MarR family transcriptional regulator